MSVFTKQYCVTCASQRASLGLCHLQTHMWTGNKK